MATLMTLSLDQLYLEPECIQQRFEHDYPTAEMYAALYQDGRDLGPLVAFHDGDQYLLADGYHRYYAAKMAGLTSVPVEVHAGGYREAIFYATSCNLHGKPLTNADKWKRVETLLYDDEWAQWSDNRIAKHCGVAHSFVGKVRAEKAARDARCAAYNARCRRTAEAKAARETRSLDSESSEAAPAPTQRRYQDRYGQIRTMDTSKIGQRESAPPIMNGTPLVLEPETNDPDAAPTSPLLARFGTGDDEWYTPPEVIALATKVLGVIDVDPASCAAAQAVVQARTFYTQAEDGLRQSWHGTVFCNPPYQMPEIARFCGKLLEELDAGHTTAALLLVNNSTDTGWFHRIAPRATAICFTDGRIAFLHTTRDASNPCQGQAILYFGPDGEHFRDVFAELGLIMQMMAPKAAGPQLALAAGLSGASV